MKIERINYIKDFKNRITKFIALQNARKLEYIQIGADPEKLKNSMQLYLSAGLIQLTYKDETYEMRINQGNKQGIYRNLKRLICQIPLYLYSKSKQDGPYTYLRYEKKLKLIRELIDC